MNQIPRRKVVLSAAALLTLPLASFAQQPPKIWRIGFLTNGTVTSAHGQLDAFRRGLNELGYVDGRNFIIESRWAEGKLDRLPALVAELLAEKPDIMFAPSGVAAQATKKSGTTIPIVFAFAPDPVGQGSARACRIPAGT
jgi:putative ABC transport system substrate-binding protein